MLHASTLLSTLQQHDFTQQRLQAQALSVQQLHGGVHSAGMEMSLYPNTGLFHSRT